MQLGNRLFPYPVLNNTKELSEFKTEANFELKLTLDENGEIIKTRDRAILKDIHFELADSDLMSLYKENKIACYLIVESPSSIYRQKYVLTDSPQTFEIPIGNLKDDVYISAYCIATCDIDNYRSSCFDDDYEGYSFNLKKYDIVAADDGMKFVMDRNLDEDNKVSSIFVIVRSDVNGKTINYEMKRERIFIYMPTEEYIKYNSMKSLSEWSDIFFSMIAIPVLTACFSEFRNAIIGGEDWSDISERYRWFRSVINSYKKETNKVLDEDVFNTTNPMELAQIVFNYSSVNGINKLYDLAVPGENEDGQN